MLGRRVGIVTSLLVAAFALAKCAYSEDKPVASNAPPRIEDRSPDSARRSGADLAAAGNSIPMADGFHFASVLWVLAAGCLIMLMPVGYALMEGGLCRARSTSHTMAMILMASALGFLAFYVYGFALEWGNVNGTPQGERLQAALGADISALNKGIGFAADKDNPGRFDAGLVGTKGFCLSNIEDPALLAVFFFTAATMIVVAMIPTGAMAERWAWKNFCIYSLWVAVPACVYGNWIWGGGWLAQMGKNFGLGHGAVDFAGSGVIHAIGGVMALAGVLCLGPRIGKYFSGRPRAMPGHSVPMVLAGTLALSLGWLGLNSGWAVAGDISRASGIIVTTFLGGVGGTVGAMMYLMVRRQKPDPSLLCNGILAGLVAISASCAFVDNWAALLTGFVAGVVVVPCIFMWDRIGIDDPVGAISVHGISGLWGILAVGIFANGRQGADWNGVGGNVKGLLYGDTGQFFAQVIDAVVVFIFGFVAAFVLFRLSNFITPMRVGRNAELQGLDGSEMGTSAYPDFALQSGMLDS
jgi:ammonium transporter, Amt family